MKFNRPYILGIDPGKRGAMAIYDPKSNSLKAVWDMPLTNQQNGKHIVDPGSLGLQIETFAKDIRYAVLEDVASRPNQSSQATFAFGESKGLVQGVLGAFMIPTYLVTPAVWKMLCGLSKDKKQSLALARKLFPRSEWAFMRSMDDGRAEAAILAHFGKRYWT